MSDLVSVIYEAGTSVYPGCKYSSWVVHTKSGLTDTGGVSYKLPETYYLYLYFH